MGLSAGARLGVYEIGSPLGAGGMGEVYRARDPRLKRDIALKVLPETTAADPDRRARFEREAQSIAALSHPNIVTIYSVEEADGVLFLTMEYVEGKPLNDFMREAWSLLTFSNCHPFEPPRRFFSLSSAAGPSATRTSGSTPQCNGRWRRCLASVST